MEGCLAFLPRKSYNKFGFLCLALILSAGVILIGIASNFDSKATLQCNPDKTLASDLSTRKYIETQCVFKYAQEFLPSLALHYQLMINVGLVLLLSLIYAYWVKGRVEIFVDTPSATTKGVKDNSPLLSSISKAALAPKAYLKSDRVFMVYNMHLIFCRIIPLVAFAVFLLTSSNYPVQYHCPWPMQTRNSSLANIPQRQSMNRFATVNCTYPMGSKKEVLSVAVGTINLLIGTLAFMELVYLLWSSWKDHNLLTDFEFCSVYILRKRKRIRKLIKTFRENMSDDIFYLHDDFGVKHLSRRKLEEIYINVIIQQRRENTLASRKKFKNRHETYKAHFKLPENAVTLESPKDLFQSRSRSRIPRTILVVGRPGIGKTLLTKKLLCQWKKQKLEFWHDKIVMLIRFCEFNQAEGRTSLREMLQRHACGFNMALTYCNQIYEYIFWVPSKVVLIFDGLDELKVGDDTLTEETSIKSHSEVTHVLKIYRQLVKGELLPGITVLTTSRPTAEHIYQDLQFDEVVEVIGFHEEQIKDYVEKFCHPDKQKSSKIWDLIKQSAELLGLCYIPVNSYIVCLTLKESIEAEGETNAPRTITELYKRAINILLFKHHREYRDKPTPKNYIIAKLPELLQNDLNKLKRIARNGMIENKLIFECDDDDVAKLSDCGLFNKLEGKRQNNFCFLHITIQEFLAALHVIDDMNNVESFLCEHIRNPWWHLVIQFVFGLVGDKMREQEKERKKLKSSTAENEQELAKTQKIIDSICKRFQDWMPKTALIEGDKNALLVIKWAHEMQVVHVMKLLAAPFENDVGSFSLREMNILPVESTALFQFLSHIKNLHVLEICRCTMEHFATHELATLLLMSKNCKLTKLLISNSNLTDESTRCLSDALKNESCKLTELDISGNELTDASGRCLSDAMKSKNCKLTELEISGNKLTDESGRCLGVALKSDNCKLTKLNVRCNKLTDESARCLSDSLKSDNCKLTKLVISGNNLTDESGRCLSDALKNNSCKLTELDVSGNELTDESGKRLSDALKSDNCKLSKLNISGNNLTDKTGTCFSDALKSGNCKLTDLNICRNKLTDESGRCLAEALKSGNCNLTKLSIKSNELTDVGAKYLTSALNTDNSKLAELDIV